MKRALLFLFGCAVFWLLVGSFASVVVDAKLLWPAFLDGQSWLTYGRLRPLADNAFLFGWASQAGLGTLLWLLARLGGASPRSPELLVSAIVLWNLGVLLGVGDTLIGWQGANPGLEFSGRAAAILSLSFLLFALCGLFLLLDRTTRPLFVSQWYLLAALLCFPWLYFTANTLLVWHPVPGPAQLVMAAWYRGGFFWLWLVPLGLAIFYYIISSVTKRPIHAYPSSVFAFRALVVLGGWTGLGPLIGGPAPAWLVSASLAAGMLMLMPVTIVEINLLGTLREAGWPRSPILSFAFFGLISLGLATVQGALTPLTGPVASFAGYAASVETMRLFAFSTMSLFGAIYFIFPELVGGEFPAARVWAHYTLGAASITIMFLSGAFSHDEAGSAFFRFLHFLSALGFLAASGLFARNLCILGTSAGP